MKIPLAFLVLFYVPRAGGGVEVRYKQTLTHMEVALSAMNGRICVALSGRRVTGGQYITQRGA